MLCSEAARRLLDALETRAAYAAALRHVPVAGASDAYEVEMRVLWNVDAALHAPWYFYAVFEALSARADVRVGPIVKTTMACHTGGLRHEMQTGVWMRKSTLPGHVHTFPRTRAANDTDSDAWFGVRVAMAREHTLTPTEARAAADRFPPDAPAEGMRVRTRRSLWGLGAGWRVDFTHVETHQPPIRGRAIGHSYEIEVECCDDNVLSPVTLLRNAELALLAIARAVGPTESAMRKAVSDRVQRYEALESYTFSKIHAT